MPIPHREVDRVQEQTHRRAKLLRGIGKNRPNKALDSQFSLVFVTFHHFVFYLICITTRGKFVSEELSAGLIDAKSWKLIICSDRFLTTSWRLRNTACLEAVLGSL